MSSEVEPIKSAQFGFLNFLWLDMKAIREKQKEGDYITALLWLLEFISYLPEDFHKKLGFIKKVEETKKKLEEIIPVGSTPEEAHFRFRKKLNDFAKTELDNFIISLSLAYDKKGYYEIKGSKVEYGRE